MSTPSIGSKISLIFQSDIRYEGILYTVDPVESTIVLAQVRTFGTENRATEHPIPPSDEIFKSIIFKTADVSNIVVCEPPQPVPQLYDGRPNDLAIVPVSKKTVCTRTSNAAAAFADNQPRNYERSGQQRANGGIVGGFIPQDEKDFIEIERQKLKIEQEKLKVEREKLTIEREKFKLVMDAKKADFIAEMKLLKEKMAFETHKLKVQEAAQLSELEFLKAKDELETNMAKAVKGETNTTVSRIQKFSYLLKGFVVGAFTGVADTKQKYD